MANGTSIMAKNKAIMGSSTSAASSTAEPAWLRDRFGTGFLRMKLSIEPFIGRFVKNPFAASTNHVYQLEPPHASSARSASLGRGGFQRNPYLGEDRADAISHWRERGPGCYCDKPGD